MQLLGRLLLIKPGEGEKTAFFLAFFLLLGAGLAVGKGSADALFIKRYGVEYFPVVYLFLSLHLALFSLLYAAWVDRLPAEKFFKILFTVQAAILLLLVAVIHFSDVELVYPMYYIVYAICSELLLVHAAFYIGQNFDTRQAKRLTPLIFAGYQFGMMGGGLLLVYAIPVTGLDMAPLLWLALSLLATGLLVARHALKGASPYYYHVHKSADSRLALAMNEIAEGIQYTRQSSLLINAAWALFFMVVTFYMLSYCANTIYTETFADETLLAGFFGKLVIVTNVAAMLMQLLLTGRIINWLGIRRANYIYPATTILSFALLLIQPGFYTALFASLNRETIMPAIRTPVRQLFFNVLPDRVKGRARAISVAVVMPAALFACGALILLAKQTEGIGSVVIAGLVCSMIYLLFTIRMGRDYISTLIASMQEKLYLPATENLRVNENSRQVIEALQRGLQSDNHDVSLSYARALVKAYPEQAVRMILERVGSLEVKAADQMLKLLDSTTARHHIPQLEATMYSGDEHMRSTVFDLLVQVHVNKRHSLIEKCLQEDNPRLRVSAIFAAILYEPDLHQQACEKWLQCLSGNIACRYASLKLIPLLTDATLEQSAALRKQTLAMLAKLLQSDDEQRRVYIYNSLQQWEGMLPDELVQRILADRDHASPDIRQAVTLLLPKLMLYQSVTPYLLAALNDGHSRVRKAVLTVIRNINDDYLEACYRLLHEEESITPRAQKVLLNEICRHAASYRQLEQLVVDRAKYAASLLCAIDAIPAHEDGALQLLRTALLERLQQTTDLILLALQPMSDSRTLQVIRAGLNSHDERHIANAVEALSELESDSIFRLVSYLVTADCEKVTAKGYGQVFKDASEVIAWCCRLKDDWLNQCGHYAAGKQHEKACA